MWKRLLQRPLVAGVVSCTWPLVLPVVVFGSKLRRLRAPVPYFQESKELLAMMTSRMYAVVVVVSVVLSAVVCAVLYSRRGDVSVIRVTRILVSLAILFVGPWLVVTLLTGSAGHGVFEMWQFPGLFERVIPSVCAGAAGVSFWFLTRPARSANESQVRS